MRVRTGRHAHRGGASELGEAGPGWRDAAGAGARERGQAASRGVRGEEGRARRRSGRAGARQRREREKEGEREKKKGKGKREKK